ncbi:MAG: hypothetical protein GY884_15515 [Proteobacteria bacterium]|nr:hypothetical protein [Pseudomonadota bacterium]
MNPIDRDTQACPATLDPTTNSKGARETKRFIDHVTTGTPKPGLEAYGEDDVKQALFTLFTLFTLFSMKCAYCEKNVEDARDVEHYRPKNEIDRGPPLGKTKPGYYWLAADWENLLLSCPQCNQRNRKLIKDEKGRWDFEEVSTGKLDQFPLAVEATRVREHVGDVADEDRLLLNPCLDPPQKHLRFDHEGNIILRQVQGKISEMARVSVMVYALDRPRLNDRRKEAWLDVADLWEDLEEVRRTLTNALDSDRDRIRRRFAKKKGKLDEALSSTAEFSAMTTHLFRKMKWHKALEVIRAELDARFPP